MARRQHWFRLWITESYSIRQLSKLSGYSSISLTRIKDYWLERNPKEVFTYDKTHYLIFDATYFHKDGCLLNLMNAEDQRIIAHLYVQKESFKETYPWFLNLRQQGLDPWIITTDGFQSVLRATELVWPQVRLQRCLYHIQHEGMRWLRSYESYSLGSVGSRIDLSETISLENMESGS
jgi:hypothetical protein